MKEITNDKIAEKQVTDKLPEEIKPILEGQNLDMHLAFESIERDLNSKIMEVTMKIRYHFPELSKYLDEMPVTIPSGNDREITLNHLKEYYESLSSILKKYKIPIQKSTHKIGFSA